MTARVVAAQRVLHVEQCGGHGRELLDVAQRIATVHLAEIEMRRGDR